MQLDKLYLLLNEAESFETGTPLEPGRYPPIQRQVQAEYIPSNIQAQIVRLMQEVQASKENPPATYESAMKALTTTQKAFSKMMNLLQINPISNLRGKFEHDAALERAKSAKGKRTARGDEGSHYIVIAGDIDNMKWLNEVLTHEGTNRVLREVGDLFKKHFDPIKSSKNEDIVKTFHPHGDEFRVVAYIGKLNDQQEIRLLFAKLLRACIMVSNSLASSGFYLKGWDKSKRIQPTISFGISTTDESASGLLTKSKTGGTTTQPLKYSVIIDRDLRTELGLTPEHLNQLVGSLGQTGNVNVRLGSLQPNLSPIGESTENPLEGLQKQRGVVALEASWSEIPPSEKAHLRAVKQEKTKYLSDSKPPSTMEVSRLPSGLAIHTSMKEPNQ